MLLLANDLSGVRWIKSSHSGQGEDCVEVAGLPGAVAVRDSKDPSGPALCFSVQEWQEFAYRMKVG